MGKCGVRKEGREKAREEEHRRSPADTASTERRIQARKKQGGERQDIGGHHICEQNVSETQWTKIARKKK
jgi:hypothetical protein